AGAQTIPVQSCRLRSHARTRPLTLERAGTGQAFNRDAGGETGVRTSAVTQATNAWRRATTQFLERGNRSQAHVAEEILRFCSVDGEEACREVALHAPQSGQAMTSPRTGAVGVEQFPSLCIRRTWAGAGERGGQSRVTYPRRREVECSATHPSNIAKGGAAAQFVAPSSKGGKVDWIRATASANQLVFWLRTKTERSRRSLR